jgi:DNA-binding transcriptional ArsR family regulator
MTKYSQFEQNNEVMNVLFAIINGKKTVNDVVKALKEPQSTVSSKLQFLRENDIVIKQKWSYDVNWDKLNKIFLRELRNQMKAWLKDETKINKFMILFNESRIGSILREYATLCIIRGKTKSASIQQIIIDYFHGLAETEDKELRKIDKRFVELKALFGMDAFEWALFFNSEYNMNGRMKKLKSLKLYKF